MDAGFVNVVEVGQYFMYNGLSRIHFSKRWWIITTKRMGSRKLQKLDLHWKSRAVVCTVNMELKLGSGLWVKTILILGSEFLMDEINMWLIQITTTQKFLQIYLKNERHNRVFWILQPDQRQRQNHKRESLWNYRAPFQWMKGCGLILNQQNLLFLRTRSRRKSSIFFDTVKRYNEKMTEQFNSGESSFIFGTNLNKSIIGRMIVGEHPWLAAGGGAKRRFEYCTNASGITVHFPSTSRTFRT